MPVRCATVPVADSVLSIATDYDILTDFSIKLLTVNSVSRINGSYDALRQFLRLTGSN